MKVASVLKKKFGFENIYRLKGGVVSYRNFIVTSNLEEQSAFIGKNFVFDGRLTESITSECLAECFQVL